MVVELAGMDDTVQLHEVATVLFDFRHTGVINEQWEYGHMV